MFGCVCVCMRMHMCLFPGFWLTEAPTLAQRKRKTLGIYLEFLLLLVVCVDRRSVSVCALI